MDPSGYTIKATRPTEASGKTSTDSSQCNLKVFDIVKMMDAEVPASALNDGVVNPVPTAPKTIVPMIPGPAAPASRPQQTPQDSQLAEADEEERRVWCENYDAAQPLKRSMKSTDPEYAAIMKVFRTTQAEKAKKEKESRKES